MIVIASHDKIDLIRSLLKDLSRIDLNGHAVTVIDTNSKNEEYLKEFPKLVDEFPDFFFESVSRDCFDSGAYIHAYKKYDADSFIFLQDSVSITNDNFIKDIDEMLKTSDVVPLFNFKFKYWTAEEQQWCEYDMTGSIEACGGYPEFGIFGPMFAVNTKTLDKIPVTWFREPANKMQACGMERRWAVIFKIIGANVKFLNHLTSDEIEVFTLGNGEPFQQYVLKKFFHRE